MFSLEADRRCWATCRWRFWSTLWVSQWRCPSNSPKSPARLPDRPRRAAVCLILAYQKHPNPCPHPHVSRLVMCGRQQQQEPPCPFRPETTSPTGAIIKYWSRILSDPCRNVFLHSLVKISFQVCVCKHFRRKSSKNHTRFRRLILGLHWLRKASDLLAYQCTFTKLNHESQVWATVSAQRAF